MSQHPSLFFEDKNLKPQDIREWVYTFQQIKMLLTALELDLFTCIGSARKQSVEIAETLNTHPKATERLMNALCAIKLLYKKENQFFNSPITLKYFVSSSPDFMAGLLHTASVYQSWSKLTQSITTGLPAISEPIANRGGEWIDSFIGAMHYRGRKQANELVEMLDITTVNTMLDLGGGSGAYAMAFVKAKPGIKATVFDLPGVIPLTKKFISLEGLESSISTLTGDYNTSDIGTGYDLILLSAIIHINSARANINLLKKCHRAMNRAGQIVIQDHVMDDNRVSPVEGALFSLNMLLATQEGDTYTESEMSSWLLDAGFSNPQKKQTPSGATQMIAIKSE